MPVFDFNATPDEKKPAECTYTVIRSNENEATPTGTSTLTNHYP